MTRSGPCLPRTEQTTVSATLREPGGSRNDPPPGESDHLPLVRDPRLPAMLGTIGGLVPCLRRLDGCHAAPALPPGRATTHGRRWTCRAIDNRRGDGPAVQRRRAALATVGGALVFAATALAFVLGAPLRPTGGVAGATGTPGRDGVGFAAPGASSDVSGFEPVRPGSGPNRLGRDARPGSTAHRPWRETGAGDRGTRRATRRRPNGRAHGAADPAIEPEPTPGPPPADAPPTPAPTPCVAVAPNLVGQHRNAARRLWSAAGSPVPSPRSTATGTTRSRARTGRREPATV